MSLREHIRISLKIYGGLMSIGIPAGIYRGSLDALLLGFLGLLLYIVNSK